MHGAQQQPIRSRTESYRRHERVHVPSIYWIITAGEMFSEESISLVATTEYRCCDTEKRATVNVDYEYRCDPEPRCLFV